MGLLTEGTPLKWEEAKQYRDHVRKHGIEQVSLPHLIPHTRILDLTDSAIPWWDIMWWTFPSRPCFHMDDCPAVGQQWSAMLLHW